MMKWSDLSPRERDALVGEKVMGWKLVRISKTEALELLNTESTMHPGARANITLKLLEGIWSDGVHCELELPHYTTDIAAAWEVVERIYDFNFRLERFEGLSNDYYGVQFLVDSNWVYGESGTAPEAICKAVLKTMGIEIE